MWVKKNNISKYCLNTCIRVSWKKISFEDFFYSLNFLGLGGAVLAGGALGAGAAAAVNAARGQLNNINKI